MLKIDQYNPVQALKKAGPQTEQQPVKAGQPTTTDTGNAHVVDAASRHLQHSFDQLGQQSEVDLDKVAAIKQALASGQLKLNDAQTAQDILEFHKK
ncbi:flagellar biosynthesis anti-sigma factor FlgM [Rheinheimera sp.]|uniref:flagellar biosynthesis anti-sigma factor FlgM n=1 Tax=Rheinheimera sp. TaxID=1869214 RepID=UPI00307E0313